MERHLEKVKNTINYPVFSLNWLAKSKDFKLCLFKQLDNEYYQHLMMDNNDHFDLNDGDKVFIGERSVHPNIYRKIINSCVRKNIKLDFIIQDEPYVNPNLIKLLLPYSKGLFLMNNIFNNIKHPLIHLIPIGLSWRSTIDFRIDCKLEECEKEILCLMLFKPHHDRDKLVNYYRDKKFVTNYVEYPPKDAFETALTNDINGEKAVQAPVYAGGNEICVQKFYMYVKKSKYVLDPPGCGIATHRFWESLYFKSIPIVKRTNTPMDQIYDFYPCLIVNEWSDVTEELLNKMYSQKIAELLDFKEKNPKIFTDPETIIETARKNY